MNFKQMSWIGLMLGLSIGFNLVGAEQKTPLETINALIVQGETYRQTGHLRDASQFLEKHQLL